MTYTENTTSSAPGSDPAFAPALTVTAAMASRRSIRAFQDTPVDAAVLREILEKAQRAPSGGNVQPWHVAMVTGDALRNLITAVQQAMMAGGGIADGEYVIYPPDLPDPYMARRYGVAHAMYDAMGIERSDKMARNMAMAQNFTGFGAPVVAFVHCPRFMGPPQWADMGIYLQSLMLLLREAGLDSCPQEAWSIYGQQVRDVLTIGDDHILYAGLAIGWRDTDAPVNNFPVARAPLDELVCWHGF